jgi:hypothetical protein
MPVSRISPTLMPNRATVWSKVFCVASLMVAPLPTT